MTTRFRASLLATAIATSTALLAPSARADTVDTCIAAAEEGQRLQRQTKLTAARERFLVCAKEACPAQLAADCKRWLIEVNEAASSVVIRARDAAGSELDDVKVFVDGKEAATKLDGKPIDVDPGPHAFRYEARGHVVQANVVIRQGERNRLLDARFDQLNAPSSSDPATQGPATAETSGSSIPTAAWLFGIGGVALGATGAVLWAVGTSQRDDLFSTCGTTRICTESDKDGPKNLLLAGDIAVVAGVAAIAAAVGITIFSKPTRVSPALLPGGGALTASRSF